MIKHRVGTKFTREYKGKAVTILVTSNGYKYGSKVFRSLSAAVKNGIGSTTPASVFFKTKSSKVAAKAVRKTRKGKPAPQVAETHSPSLSGMINEMVKREVADAINSLREEVRSAVNGAISESFLGEAH